jgi:hypothetical protein
VRSLEQKGLVRLVFVGLGLVYLILYERHGYIALKTLRPAEKRVTAAPSSFRSASLAEPYL